MRFRNIMPLILLAYFGCGEPTPTIPKPNVAEGARYMKGIVMKEAGSLPGLLESSGAVFGNESVKLGEKNYALTIKGEDGNLYTAEVVESIYPDNRHNSNGRERFSDANRTMIAFATAVDSGTQVEFVNMYIDLISKRNGIRDSDFHWEIDTTYTIGEREHRIGRLTTAEIRVLN